MAVLPIEKAIVSILLNDADISAMIGTGVYAFRLPQTVELPAITYKRIATSRVLTHDQTHIGLSRPRFQFDVYADTYDECKQLVEALRKALQGLKGAVTIGDSVNIYAILPELEMDAVNADVGFYYTTVDYSISHNE